MVFVTKCVGALEELRYLKENLIFQNSRPLKIELPKIFTQALASTTGDIRSYQRKRKHVNVTEVIIVKLTIQVYTKEK